MSNAGKSEAVHEESPRVQNVSGRALSLPNGGDLAPLETVEVESTRGLKPLFDAGLLVQIEDEPKKKEAIK